MSGKMFDNHLFQKNRKKFVAKSDPSALSVFNSNDQMPTNADGLMPFRQNNDLFYLCGIDQEETTLFLFPESKDESFREVLFIKKTNETIKIWEGSKLTIEEAQKISGIKTVLWNENLNPILEKLTTETSSIYLSTNEHPRAEVIVETKNIRFLNMLKKRFPKHAFLKSAPIMHQIRSVKEPEEIALIKRACEITKLGLNRILKFIKPGVFEYNLEAELIHEFINNKSRGFAYEPIIASGKNACVLHYTQNNQKLKDGDVVLMDFGAEYVNYASDLTRCVPVNGRFTKRQKDVYISVLRVMTEAKKLLVPGLLLSDYEGSVGKIMERELVNLGLLSMKDLKSFNKSPSYKKYYMHGTSHHLGLDVHDVSDPKKPLCPGMVLTCEPGIYIPEEGLGIRLENDILVTKNEPEDLMGSILISPEEIEDALNS